MGSYPTQATPAFSQLTQLGSRWSHRFFRKRQRLQALTLRKLLLWLALPLPPAPPEPAAALALAPFAPLAAPFAAPPAKWSSVGDVVAVSGTASVAAAAVPGSGDRRSGED